MPNQAATGVPVPPSPSMGGGAVPGIPKAMSPMGTGPGPGLAGVPETGGAGGIVNMFQGYTAGAVPREELVSALQAQTAGPGGISGLLAELGGSASAGRDMVFSSEHRALIKILITAHGLDQADAIGIVAELIMNGGPAPAGGPPMNGGPGGGGPPVAPSAPTIAPPVPGPGMPNLGAQTGGPV
jgi:hypothetical protein